MAGSGALAGLALASPAAVHAAEEPSLRFERDGALGRELGLAELRAACEPRRVEVDDPYYGRPMAFLASPLGCVLRLGFGAEGVPGGDENVFLRARDGYTRPATGARLAEAGAHLAFADATLGEGFLPIDRRQVDPAPFYLFDEIDQVSIGLSPSVSSACDRVPHGCARVFMPVCV